MNVSRGVQEKSFLVYDNGRLRKDAEVMALSDIPNSTLTSSVINRYFVVRKRRKGKSFGGNPLVAKLNASKIEKIEFYYEHTSLVTEIVRKTDEFRKKNQRVLKPNEVGGVMLYLRLDKKYPVEVVDSFFEQLADYRICNVEAINKLRDKLLGYANAKGKLLTDTFRFAFLIKTWNYYIRQQPLKVLSYSPEKEKDLWFI